MDEIPVNLPQPTKVEIHLHRLLNRCEKQAEGGAAPTADSKLRTYVAVMREQLAVLEGRGGQQSLPSISRDKAADYQRRIEAVAEKLGKPVPGSLWRRDEGRAKAPEESGPAEPAATTSGRDAAAEGSSPNALRRRNRPPPPPQGSQAWHDEHKGRTAQLESSSMDVIEKNRQLQDGLTDDLLELAQRLKANSLLYDVSIQESNKVLDSSELVVEENLVNARQATARAKQVYSRSWFTGFSSWLLIAAVCFVFFGMIVLIRLT